MTPQEWNLLVYLIVGGDFVILVMILISGCVILGKEDMTLDELKQALADLKKAIADTAARIQAKIDGLKANATDPAAVAAAAAEIESDVAALGAIGADPPATAAASEPAVGSGG